MLKSLLLIIILLLGSYNLFSQRLCEETFQTRGLFKTNDPNIIIIENQTGLFWYDAESCEFVDTMDFGKYNSVQTRITPNGKYCLILLTTEYTNFKLTKFDLEQKTEIGTYTFEFENSDNYLSNFYLRDNGNELIVLSADDKRLIEYNLDTQEEIRFVSTPSPSLSQLKVSPNGNLLGITTSPFSEFNKVLHIYNAHTLEFMRSLNFRDYFEELDIQINSGFEFDPVSNDIYLGSDKKLIRYDFESKQTTTILDQYRINSSNMNFSESGDTLFVDFKPDGVNTEIGIVNTNAKDEFYTLPGFSLWAIPFKNYLIVGNDNFSKNIFKLSLLTGVEEQYQGDINLYPNPNSGNLEIEINNIHPSQIEIKLYDIQGALILDLLKEFIAEDNFIREFSLGSLPNGTYLVEIKINEERFIEELILEK